jgi:hypothetical protein
VIWVIALVLGGCSVSTLISEPSWDRELNQATTDAEIRVAMQRISGGIKPQMVRGHLHGPLDQSMRSRIARAVETRFNCVAANSSASPLAGPERFIFRENDILVLYVVYDEVPPSYRAYATVASGDQRLAREILEFIKLEFE